MSILSKNEKYFLGQTADLAKELSQTGILVFPDFITPEAIVQLQKESAVLKSKAYRSESSYNVYVKPSNPNFPQEDIRNRQFKTSKACVPDDLIPDDSVLRQIYRSNFFRTFMCQLLGVNHLFPYADSLSSININYYEPGDSLEWHFDNSDFTITLLVQACKQGGMYEYLTDMRYKVNGEENYELVEKVVTGKVMPQQQTMSAGGLMVFKGNKSLHRVTPIIDGERILVTFNFNTKPGVALSEQSRLTFFGRTE